MTRSHRVRLILVGALVAACQHDRSPQDIVAPGLLGLVPSGGPAVLVGAGDIASCKSPGDEATAELLDTIPGTVFTAGDNAYDMGTIDDYTNCYGPTWGRHKARTHPATGNHDYNDPGAAGYWQYYGPIGGDSGKYYYSYDLGAWHVVVLNSNIDESATSAQIQWLKNDLAASPARCTIAYWHHPRFTSGTTTSAFNKNRQGPAWDVLYDAGAEIVVNGHEHSYERFGPQRPTGAADQLYGIREFIVGTGGDEINYPFGTPVPNSEVRDNTSYGVIKFTLDSTGYTWHFWSGAGEPFTDSGSDSCHGRPPNAPPVAVPGGPYSTKNGTVHFDGSASADTDGNYPLLYHWDFGDGAHNDDGARPTHTYLAGGIHAVTLTVTDSRGAQSAPMATLASVSRGDTMTVTFSGAGNIARCTNDNDEATAVRLDALPGFVFALGDNALPGGSTADYTNCYTPTWGRHRTRTLAVLGNHEYDPGSADPTFDYFGSGAGPRGLGYFSVDRGAWHIIVLNDNATFVPFAAGSAQEQWLRADLAANTKPCTMAMWHTPLFQSSTTPGFLTNSTRKVLWNDLYAAGVDVVVNGNSHHYERFALLTPSGGIDSSAGIKQFTVGTGGEALTQPTVIHPLSEVQAAVFGVLKLTLRNGRYDWEFLSVAGQSFHDAGSGACHGPPVNHPPTANPGGPYSTSDGTIHFDGRASSDPDGNGPLTYQWDFGDGNGNDGAQPSHTYTADGSYTIRLTAMDAAGATSTPATTTVQVARADTTRVTLVGAANIATCGATSDDATAAVLDGTAGFVFTVGDNANPKGSDSAYATCYHPAWGRQKTRTFPTLGNHDYDLGNAAGSLNYFGSRMGSNGGSGYYSFNLGLWHVIVLNDNASYVPFARGSAQEQWLQADLAANARPCTIAVWHAPLFFSSNTSGFTSNSSRKVLWDDLYAAGADLVINGDQYDYERLAPMSPTGAADSARGIRSFNVGTGGQSLSLPTVAIHPNSEVRAASYGVLRLTLRDGGYDWEFLPAAGQTFHDSGTGSCH